MKLICGFCTLQSCKFLTNTIGVVLVIFVMAFSRVPLVYGDNTILVTAKVLTAPPILFAPSPVVNSPTLALRGQCSPDKIVKVLINDVFAGQEMCKSNSEFIIKVELFPGENNITAAHYAPDLASEFSPTVIIMRAQDSEAYSSQILKFISTPIDSFNYRQPGHFLTKTVISWPVEGQT